MDCEGQVADSRRPVETSTYEEWTRYIFERWHEDVGPSDSHWNLAILDRQEPARALDYMTRLFTDPGGLLRRYDRDQLGQGLHYLASGGESEYGILYVNPALPLEARVAGVHAIATLYERLFAPACAKYLSHLEVYPHRHAERNELNGICYMWWDVFPMYGRTRHPTTREEPDVRDHNEDHRAIERACLTAMERTLDVDHPACLEGALHGLGHWSVYYPEVAIPAIDRFLARRPDLPEDLAEYARAARAGAIQ